MTRTNASRYKARDYSFGQMVLSWRESQGWTQEQLGVHLAVSTRTLQNWENGATYPDASRLRRLLALVHAHGLLPAGQELAEAQRIWELVALHGARMLPRFDVAWFTELTAAPQLSLPRSHAPEHQVTPLPSLRADWGDAMDVGLFAGRTTETALVRQWVCEQRCRLVALLGMGGIGKTTLAVALAEQIGAEFDVIVFRSLRNAQRLEVLLNDYLAALDPNLPLLPTGIGPRLTHLMTILQRRRCLLILDNVETIMQTGVTAGRFRDGYDDYGQLLQVIGTGRHQSCMLITSREKPTALASLEGLTTPVRTLMLSGVDVVAAQAILHERSLVGNPAVWEALDRRLGGNPLALKLVGEAIDHLFGGDIELFLAQQALLFDGVRQLLDQHWSRLSKAEQTVLRWLAIEREPTTLERLTANIIGVAEREALLPSLEALRRRNLIEHSVNPPGFTLQPVVLEYVTDTLINTAVAELTAGAFAVLRDHALLQAQAKEYVRESQARVIVEPILAHLQTLLGSDQTVVEHLIQLLPAMRALPHEQQGYGSGNLVNLIAHVRGHLNGLDLSSLTLRQIYLAGVALQDTDLRNAFLTDAVFTDDAGAAGCVAFSPDGRYLASGTMQGELRIRHAQDGVQIAIATGHAGVVWALAFRPDNQVIASASFDGTIKLWQLPDGACIGTLHGHHDPITALCWHPDGRQLISGGVDGTLRIWDTQNQRLTSVLRGDGQGIYDIVVSPDGELLYSAGTAPNITLWDLPSGRQRATWYGHSGMIYALVANPNGRQIASGGADGRILLWDTDYETGVYRTLATGARLRSLAFSADGALLASGHFDGSVRIWDLSSGTGRAVVGGHTHVVFSLAFHPNGKSLISSSEDQSLKVWDVEQARSATTFASYHPWVSTLAFHPGKGSLAGGGNGSDIQIWNWETGRVTQTLKTALSGSNSIAYSPDGAWLAVAASDHRIHLLDAETGAIWRQLRRHSEPVVSVLFSPDGQFLASGSYDRRIILWDLQSGEPIQTMESSDRVRSLAFDPYGRWLASGNAIGEIVLWELPTGQPVHVFAGHSNMVHALAYHPAGTALASSSADQTVRIWNANVAAGQTVLHGHRNEIRAVAYHPHGVLIASGSDDRTVRLWNAQGDELAVLKPDTGRIRAVAWSPDGRILAGSGEGGWITWWDAATWSVGKQLRADRPYERLRIDGLGGLTLAQRSALQALGALSSEPYVND